ncbi:MAG TPA: sulfatase [Draconibacterium sp.]|nr:sulfatase [Draconibacterium sp.]
MDLNHFANRKASIGILIFCLLIAFGGCKSNESNPPNIVFIMSDDHAFQAISAYGSDLIETPNIDHIADDGIIFNKAFVTNSICAPSRAVILSGKFSHLNGVKGNSEQFDGTQQTFPKLLQANGYQTAIVGKWHLKSAPTGFDYWNVLPGQGDYYNPDFIKLGKDTTYKGYVTEIISKLSIDWLKSRDKKKPFLLMMHHKAPHRSWMPALKNLELFDEKKFPLPTNFDDDYNGRKALQRQLLTVKNHMDIRMDFKVPCNECDTSSVNSWAPGEYWRRLDRLNPEERQKWNDSYKKEETEYYQVKDDETKYDHWKFRRYMEDYLRCIVSVDESVGQILDFLKENNLDENTLVVYTSDQGFYLGEHGLFDKRFMYEEAMRTPLLIRYPKEIKAGSRSSQLVQNLDIAPTILHLAGIDVPADMQGLSLKTIWQNPETDWRDAIYYHYYEKGFGATPHYGIRTERYKLIHFYDDIDSWELYDLDLDPTEMTNLYSNSDYQKVLADLKIKLSELSIKYKDELTN